MRRDGNRLRTLEDSETIQGLHNEHIYHLLTGQWRERADCFAENAYVLISRYEKYQDKEEIDMIYSERISQANPRNGRDAYFIVMPVITMDGDNAKGYLMLHIFIADPVNGFFPGLTI